jgi:hypothetical protein
MTDAPRWCRLRCDAQGEKNGFPGKFAFLLLALTLLFGIMGCSRVNTADKSPSRWFLIGMDNGRFVFRHKHKTYKAECVASMVNGDAESMGRDCDIITYYLNGDPIEDVTYMGTSLEVGNAHTEGGLYYNFEVVTIEEGDA